MSQEATATTTTTLIARGSELALSSFQECLFRAARLHPREYTLFEDQLARFSIWASDIGVFASGRASIDHRLREVPDVADAVTSLLENVTYGMKECSLVLESITGSQSQTSEDALTDPDPRLVSSVQAVADEISMLYRLSNTIRRASRESHNLKVAKISDAPDNDGNDSESKLREVYCSYIRGQFPSIQDSLCERLASSMIIRRRRILYRRFHYGSGIRTHEIISQPLIQLPQNQRQALAGPGAAKASQPVMGQTPAKSDLQSQAVSATTLSVNAYKNAPAPPVMSTTKSIPLGSHEDLVFPPPPNERIKSRYKALERQRRQLHKEFINSLSGLVSVSERQEQIYQAETELQVNLELDWRECCKAVPELTCPFCLYVLPSLSVGDDKKWKHVTVSLRTTRWTDANHWYRAHVTSDLDAYVCLFDKCDRPEQLYHHSSDWLKHMRSHTLRWRCKAKSHKPQIYPTENEYIEHMREFHPGSFTEPQLRALADANARSIGPMFQACPMCGTEAEGNSLEDHIVGHLRLLALRSLPPHVSQVLDSPDEQEDSTDDRVIQEMLEYKRKVGEVSLRTTGIAPVTSSSSSSSSSYNQNAARVVTDDNIKNNAVDGVQEATAEQTHQTPQPQESTLKLKNPETLPSSNELPTVMDRNMSNSGLKSRNTMPLKARFEWNNIVKHRYEKVDILIKYLDDEFGSKNYRVNDKNRPGIQIWLPNNKKLTEKQIATIHRKYVEAHRKENADDSD
ncbi:hypothetical protein PFICI_01034 [Pestalotiopsis fici W106-1]|uniref:C2H2-type domain-containing protein n=1 Tax=Pestalotiopsis fici (strain W106-1 / CGMCC3.15140) TaxID=1229662 RepID=W3XPM9_PESFW|nr:uncharacterized protein PFICI_01034 [Pestalotiopsis fici W106-1]ETS87206.1 hypothetical protein PFICI_01034 [Pestalotiopsis fici W106-1]